MSTLILGALEAELTQFRSNLANRSDEQWNALSISEGNLDGAEVIVASCGVGKAMAAMATQHFVDRYAPSRLIFTGIAGSLNRQLEIGDVVVARDSIQYDLDARAAGFEIGQIPFTSYREIPCDPDMVSAALSYPAEGFRLVEGRILTGDRFLARVEADAADLLSEELAGDAVEMEGASVGLVALFNGLPFLLLRTISDKADGSAKADFKKFLPVASERAFRVVLHLLRAISHSAG